MATSTALRAGLLAGFLAFAAACGAPAPATPGPGAQTPGAPGLTPVGQPGQPTPAGQPGQPGAGHDLQDPCGLATVEEVSAALGVTVVNTEETVGDPPTYCNYRTADGTLVLGTSYSVDPINATVFRSFAGAEDAVPVPGLGDEAVVSGGALYVRQGDAMVGIQPSANAIRGIREDDDPEFELSEQDIIAFLTQIGQAVAGRL